jgi:hypothetical protein
MRTGEATTEQAILHAAVHGWYEGHIQGEDACPGCDFRGELRKQTHKGWWTPAATNQASPSTAPSRQVTPAA